MFSDEYEGLCAELDAIVAHSRANAEMRAVLSRVERQLEPTIIHNDLCALRGLAPEDIRWRVMDHCSAVGRLYAVYEHFCENVLHEWLYFLSARKPFLDLPEQIVGSYQTGFAHIVSRLPSPRYDHLSIEDLVSGYDTALKGELTYSLAPECLSHRQSNLRWNELTEIYRRFGILDVGEWLSKDDEIKDFFGNAGARTVEQITSKLSELVQYRNDASHGLVSVDEILGQQQFMEFATFIRVLCSSLNALHRRYALALLQETGDAQKIGTLTEKFRGNVVIVKVTNGTLEKGQAISFLADGYCVERRVLSMQVDDVEVSAMSFVGEVEVGIKLDRGISRKKAAVITNLAW